MLPDMTHCPFAENATLDTQSECPVIVDWQTQVPVELKVQIFRVLSSLALARHLPSGLHVTSLTSLKVFKS